MDVMKAGLGMNNTRLSMSYFQGKLHIPSSNHGLLLSFLCAALCVRNTVPFGERMGKSYLKYFMCPENTLTWYFILSTLSF